MTHYFNNQQKIQLFKRFFCGLLVLSSILPFTLDAKAKEEVTIQMRHSAIEKAIKHKKYKLAIEHGKAILAAAPASPFAPETTYQLGVAYFHLRDFDLANHYFSQFLEKFGTPDYFEEVIEYKYKIAEEFETGSGRHVFGVEKLPKWVNAWEDAQALYDEIIKTVPSHELAAKALFRKGEMLKAERKFKESLEAYRTITRRFPKNPLAPESYLAIAKLYVHQSQFEYPDRDFLYQARLNLKKFKRDFPSEDRLIEAEALLAQMQDSYAKDLWVSAKYYERKKNYEAARIYYAKIAKLYPESSYAKEAVAKIAKPNEFSMTIVNSEEDFTSSPSEGQHADDKKEIEA